jgi:transcriptional regulator with XRE-family HTH domain
MKIEGLLTEDQILVELGHRLAQCRLEAPLTQAELAERAGVSKRTVERIEAGATTQLSTMIRLLRALGLLDRLDGLIREAGARPMDLLKLQGKVRQRAPRKRRSTNNTPWQWGDES